MNRAINGVIVVLVLFLIALSVHKFFFYEEPGTIKRTLTPVFVQHLDDAKPIQSSSTVNEFTIAFINANNNIPIMNRLQYEFTWLIEEEQSGDKNISVDFFDSEGEDAKQINQISNVYSGNKHYDILILIATSKSPDIPDTIRAMSMQYDTKLIVLNRAINLNSKNVWFVLPDNYQAGKAQAEHVAQHLTKNSGIFYLQGPPDFIESSKRYTGFAENLKKLRPDIAIIDSKVANYNPEQAEKIVLDWMDSDGGDKNTIVCGNDMITLGALNALKKKKLEGKVPVVGIDGYPSIIEEVRDGNIVMTCHQRLYDEALVVFNICTDLYEGRNPYYSSQIQFDIVTKDNVIMFKDPEKY